MSIPAKRFIRSLLLRLFPKASEPMLVLLLVRAGNPNRGPGYRASLRTPDEGAHLVTRGIILNPRYGDPPPELSISLATFSPCTSHKRRHGSMCSPGIVSPTRSARITLRPTSEPETTRVKF